MSVAAPSAVGVDGSGVLVEFVLGFRQGGVRGDGSVGDTGQRRSGETGSSDRHVRHVEAVVEFLMKEKLKRSGEDCYGRKVLITSIEELNSALNGNSLRTSEVISLWPIGLVYGIVRYVEWIFLR